MVVRNLVLADPAFLDKTNIRFGSAGSFFEAFEGGAPPLWEGLEVIPSPYDFTTPNATFAEPFVAGAPPEWEGLEVIPSPFDFSAPDATTTETFNNDWT